MERLGITMLINDKSQLKGDVEQIGFQLVLKTRSLDPNPEMDDFHNLTTSSLFIKISQRSSQ